MPPATVCQFGRVRAGLTLIFTMGIGKRSTICSDRDALIVMDQAASGAAANSSGVSQFASDRAGGQRQAWIFCLLRKTR